MLVIRRHAGQSILIGDDVEIQVIEISPTRVKLGIAAPRQISILRKEVRLTGEENQVAARAASPDQLGRLLQRFRHRQPPERG
jgi:carbon storage regulator